LTASLRSQQSRTISTDSIKYYKYLLPAFQPSTATLSPAQWKRFQLFSITLSIRTTWYHCIHENLTTKQCLHQQILNSHRSPLCSTCALSTIEDNFHFFFARPSQKTGSPAKYYPQLICPALNLSITFFFFFFDKRHQSPSTQNLYPPNLCLYLIEQLASSLAPRFR
jgi:hypothetical protein